MKKKVQSLTAEFVVEQKNGVVQKISKAFIMQPVTHFNGGTVKWYEDKKRK